MTEELKPLYGYEFPYVLNQYGQRVATTSSSELGHRIVDGLNRNDKAVIDEFLAAVVKEMHKGYFTDRDCTALHMIFNQVYAEMFGGGD